MKRVLAFVIAALVTMLGAALAAGPSRAAALPLDAGVTAQSGERVHLGALLGPGPAVVVPVYYRCPNLCALTFAHLLDTAATLPNIVVVVYSIDSSETTDDAAAFAAAALQEHQFPPAGAVHFIIADGPTVKRINDGLGVSFDRDKKSGQFAHPAMMAVVSPTGHVVRRFGGLSYDARALAAALTAAAQPQPTPELSQEPLWLTCFHGLTGDGGKAGMWRMIRIADGLIVLVIAAGVGIFLRRRTRGNTGAGS